MRTIVSGGTILTPDETLSDHTLIIEDGVIVAIENGLYLSAAGSNEKIIDASGLWVTPGLIDLHVHGSAGSDTMDATPFALARMSNFFIQHGVTSFLPTTISAAQNDITSAITNVEKTAWSESGAHHQGVYLEGPYLASAMRGIHPEEHIRRPAPDEYEPWLRSKVVRLIAIAPEIPGALTIIEKGIAKGIRFAAGHCQASYEQMALAAELGLNQATHTFNGMLGLHHREPGTVGMILSDDRLYAEVIVDGIHIHPAVVQVLVRVKGIDRTILITDAIRAAGMADGEYALGGSIVHVKAGIARTASGGLAGSTLTLDQAIRNVMQFTGITFNQALTMASKTPAQAMGWCNHKGVLQPGADADVILWDTSLTVRASILAGNLVYQNFS